MENILFTNFKYGTDSIYGMIWVEECTEEGFEQIAKHYKYNSVKDKELIYRAIILSDHTNIHIHNESKLDEIIEEGNTNSCLIIDSLTLHQKLLVYANQEHFVSDAVIQMSEFQDLILDKDDNLDTLNNCIRILEISNEIQELISYTQPQVLNILE